MIAHAADLLPVPATGVRFTVPVGSAAGTPMTVTGVRDGIVLAAVAAVLETGTTKTSQRATHGWPVDTWRTLAAPTPQETPR